MISQNKGLKNKIRRIVRYRCKIEKIIYFIQIYIFNEVLVFSIKSNNNDVDYREYKRLFIYSEIIYRNKYLFHLNNLNQVFALIAKSISEKKFDIIYQGKILTLIIEIFTLNQFHKMKIHLKLFTDYNIIHFNKNKKINVPKRNNSAENLKALNIAVNELRERVSVLEGKNNRTVLNTDKGFFNEFFLTNNNLSNTFNHGLNDSRSLLGLNYIMKRIDNLEECSNLKDKQIELLENKLNELKKMEKKSKNNYEVNKFKNNKVQSQKNIFNPNYYNKINQNDIIKKKEKNKFIDNDNNEIVNIKDINKISFFNDPFLDSSYKKGKEYNESYCNGSNNFKMEKEKNKKNGNYHNKENQKNIFPKYNDNINNYNVFSPEKNNFESMSQTSSSNNSKAINNLKNFIDKKESSDNSLSDNQLTNINTTHNIINNKKTKPSNLKNYKNNKKYDKIKNNENSPQKSYIPKNKNSSLQNKKIKKSPKKNDNSYIDNTPSYNSKYNNNFSNSYISDNYSKNENSSVTQNSNFPNNYKQNLKKYVNSEIFYTRKELSLLKDKISHNNRKIHVFFDLLYRTSRDGQYEKLINRLCFDSRKTLTLFHTTEGARFGIYQKKEENYSFIKGKYFLEVPGKCFIVGLNNLIIYDILPSKIANDNFVDALCFGKTKGGYMINTPKNKFIGVKCVMKNYEELFGDIDIKKIIGNDKGEYHIKEVEVFDVAIEL